MQPTDDTAELVALLAEHVAAIDLHVKRARAEGRPLNHLYLAEMLTSIRQGTAALGAAVERERTK